MATVLEQEAVPQWALIDRKMRVVKLTTPLQLLVPALGVASLSKSTRGLSLYPGRAGLALGAVLASGGVVLGALLFGPVGVVASALAVWLLGSAGGVLAVSSVRPTAYVKDICTGCRLLPVIREHEAIHLSGVASEKAVWDSMKTRHSVKSLSLAGDPSVCDFCPIPKRLSEH